MDIIKYKLLVSDYMLGCGFITKFQHGSNFGFVPKSGYKLLNGIHPFPVIEYKELGIIDIMIPNGDALETHTFQIKHKKSIMEYAFFFDSGALCGLHCTSVDGMVRAIHDIEHKAISTSLSNLKWIDELGEYDYANFLTKYLSHHKVDDIWSDCCDDNECCCECDGVPEVLWYSPIGGYDKEGLTRHSVGNGIMRDWSYEYNTHNDVLPIAKNIQFGNLCINKPNRKDYLYCIRLSNDEETFIKVGRTFDMERRMKDFVRVGYAVDVLHTKAGIHTQVCDMEDGIKNELHNHGFGYKPLISFGGSISECFDSSALNHESMGIF